MAETLRDLVVSLSLQSDNFTRNIRSVNKQIQEAESFFKLAAAGVDNFDQSTTGLASRLSTLQQKLSLQREVVDQYQRALQAARDKLQECYDRQGDYANRLADAQSRQTALNDVVRAAADAYMDCRNRLGESDQATLDAASHLTEVRERYRETSEEVRKLAGQCEALQRATQNAADAVSTGNSNLNKASAAVRQTESDIQKTNNALALSQTNWRAAGESIIASRNAINSIGKQMQSAEATFRLMTVGIKDVDSSTDGLSAKMTMLTERLRLQNQAFQEYDKILRAAREQLAAAQSVNDPNLIRQATDAVTDAKTALIEAQTAVMDTVQAIEACNTQLTLANNGWFAAAESIKGSEAAIAGIGNQLRLAESEFNLITAGMQNADTTVAGLTARANMLTQQLNLQNQAVAEYANILGQAQVQLAAAQAANDPERINQATQAVTNAQTALNNANAAVKNTEAQLQACNNELTLANSGWYSAAEAMSNAKATIAAIGGDIARAESEFRLATAGIENMDSSVQGLTAKLDMLYDKWMLQYDAVDQYKAALQAAQQQLAAAQAAGDPAKIQQASSAVTEAQTALNNARAALSETGRQIDQCNQALALAETNWHAAGEAITRSQAAIATIGRQIKVAESAFKASTAGIKDMDKSVYGLTEKLNMLQQRMQLQKEAVKQYQNALMAARDQLQAAQQANDPDKIREANDAVLEAEAALNNARAAVRETGAEINNLQQRLKVLNSAWTSAGAALTTFSTRLTNIGKSMVRIGRTMSMYITTPIVALGKKVIQASLDFESSFAYVRKTVQATEEQYDKLTQASKRMSTEIATSTDEINQVMATGGQLGIATEHIEDFSRVMIDLARSAADLDADTAATQLAKFANIMGTSQDQFSNIGSAVAVLGNNFATTEGPIVEMAMRLAGAGRQIGLTEAQVLGLSASLSSVGVQAQMGGSSMSKALIKMEVAAETGGQALKDFAGVCKMSEKEFVEAWKDDPVRVFQRFIEELSKLDDEGASAIATLDEIGISEIRLRDTLLRATNSTELFARAQDMAVDAWEKNTALTEMAGKRYATTASRLTNLKNKAMLFAQQLGNDLNPTIKKVTEGVSSFIDRLSNLDEAQRLNIMKWAAFAAATGPVILILGRLATGTGKVIGVLGKFATAVGQAGGGFSGFVSVLAKSPAVWFAVAAAVAVGVYALLDWASGAKKAREATKQLNDTAEEWKNTAAETFYGAANAGLSFFGMSKENFTKDKTAQSARAWMTGLIDVWTDGKGETNEIVKEWTDGWKQLTENTRTALTDLQNSAKESGYTGVADQIQADINSLDSMDKEIESLLKKRQNGYLTDDEKLHLQDLIDQRDAIILKYKLQPDSNTDGFNTIREKLEAEVARAQALGKENADVSVYQNAMVAAAQGLAAVNREIDAQYDKEYALIQMMEEGDEKAAALAELNSSYNEQRLAAAREYAQLLSETVMPVWESPEMQKTGDQVSDLAGKLTAYDAAVKAYGQDSLEAANALEAVSNAAAALDEGSLTEYATTLSQISELLTSGLSMEEVQALFPEIDLSGALEQLAAVQELTDKYSSSLGGLASMFGEGLSEEVLKIATELDMTGAKANWAEFASDPGAITTEAIIAGIQEDENAARQQVKVDAVVGKLITTNAETGEVSLTVDGVIAYVTQYAESTNGADVSGLTPEIATCLVAGYAELAGGADVSTLKPSEIVAYVSKYAEEQGVDLSGLTPEGLTAFVMAYQEITGGALTTALTPDDVTAMVVKYLEAEGVDMSALKPDQVEALVNKFSEATGCDKSGLAESLTAYITSYDDSAATVPTPKVKLEVTGYEATTLRNFVANNPVEVNGVVRLGDKFENPEDALNADNTQFYYNGKPIPVELVPANMLTAETIIAYDADGTLHVLITPELGSPEGLESSAAEMNSTPLDGTIFRFMSSSATEAVTTIVNLKSSIDDLNGSIAEAKENGTGFDNMGISLWHLQEQLDSTSAQMQTWIRWFTEEDLAAIGTRIENLMAALNSGEGTPEEITAWKDELSNLQTLIGIIKPEDYSDTGTNICAGIGMGMQNYDFSGDAAATQATLLEDINSALGVASPATTMLPTGENVAAGIGQGMSQYDFSTDAQAVLTAIEAAFSTADFATTGAAMATGLASGLADADMSDAASSVAGSIKRSLEGQLNGTTLTSTGDATAHGIASGMQAFSFESAISDVANTLKSAASSALNGTTLTAVGRNVMSGLASGIRSGSSTVVSAMRAAAQAAVRAAKSELQIQSPSRVFRDEVGTMVMKGFGEGIERETARQAKVITNAARYLTDEAQVGVAAGNSDNRRTYNLQSSVNLHVDTLSIRDKQDIHDLAVEIAGLTKRQQRGKGLRMA